MSAQVNPGQIGRANLSRTGDLAAGKPIFDPRDYGAKGDGMAFDTAAVQAAIDACSASGGGTVVLSGGTFLVKPIELKGGVELHLEGDARLLGSGDWRDYPNRDNMRHVVSADILPRGRDAALIWADEAENVSITGEGTIDANGMSFVRKISDADRSSVYANMPQWNYVRCGGYDQSPPRVVFFAGCLGVTVRDVLLTNQPAGWGFWVHDCDRVVFDRCRIHSDVTFPNNDGIHVNASRDVSIRNCTVESGDDAIVVRCNTRSLHERKTCERVTVENCDLRSYANCIRVAWCGEGVIRDCSFSGLTMHDSACGIGIWFVPKDWNPSGDWGCERTRIENLAFSGIRMERIHGAPVSVRIFEGAEDAVDSIHNVLFSDFTCRSFWGPCFQGTEKKPLEGIRFSDCRFIRDPAAAPPWKSAEGPYGTTFLHCRALDFDCCEFDNR